MIHFFCAGGDSFLSGLCRLWHCLKSWTLVVNVGDTSLSPGCHHHLTPHTALPGHGHDGAHQATRGWGNVGNAWVVGGCWADDWTENIWGYHLPDLTTSFKSMCSWGPEGEKTGHFDFSQTFNSKEQEAGDWGEQDGAELARYSKNYLPILINLMYFMISDTEMVNTMFDRALEKYRTENLQFTWSDGLVLKKAPSQFYTRRIMLEVMCKCPSPAC